MNIFNRVVAILLLLILLGLALLLTIVPGQTLAAGQRALENLSGFLVTLESSPRWLYLAGRIICAIVALVVFGLLLWAELRSRRPRAVRVRTEAGSQATVTTDSVARRLTWHIDQLADVISVTPQVTARGKSVDVLLDLETTPDIDVPMKTDEVVAVARDVITSRMGMQLGKVQVRIRHAPYEEKA